jgi:ribosomal-protein-alanine N-acetyltransferase
MRAPAEPPSVPIEISIGPMKRRHVRDVLSIERRVYPRPWSAALFFSEISQKSSRYYIVSHHGRTLIGYGGLMVHLDEAHITTVAVAPEYQHRKVGSRLLSTLLEEARSRILHALCADAIARDVRTLTLEVRVANWPAQRLYSWFGFRPVGVRKNYYAETGEDALVMWVDDLKSEDMRKRLDRIARAIHS